ncbi:NUDIX hydrolase [Pseudonocardia sp. TRM90224]|uniref:NUDIX hydrolase n=1 Tax=Pseudonocardia sp. TRM90224 TaxID=2812678 RepID=UPI001E4666FE|nr:NUDIX hydrolase [Pseudonocardia sp. TRM90224]
MPAEPVVPKPAATVLLVRDAPDPAPGRTPLQVFLQRRVAGMAFAGGMTVFPGGGVDQRDRAELPGWTGPDPASWAQRLDCDAELAGALVQAAVRETFEECGVLLAGPGAPEVAELKEERADLVARRASLADVLSGAGLVLRSDLLRAWARWVTPVASPKRYDAAFFVALVPEGQEADAHTTEAVEATWWYPAEALEHWQSGDMQLMAPTFRTLQEIGEHPDSASVLAAAEHRVIRPLIPRVRREGEQVIVVLPDDPDFEISEDHLTPGTPGGGA